MTYPRGPGPKDEVDIKIFDIPKFEWNQNQKLDVISPSRLTLSKLRIWH